jgi:hypothetical protein
MTDELANANVRVESTFELSRSFDEVNAHLREEWEKGVKYGKGLAKVAGPLLAGAGQYDSAIDAGAAAIATELEGRADGFEVSLVGDLHWRFELLEQASGTLVHTIHYNTSALSRFTPWSRPLARFALRKHDDRLRKWAEGKPTA